MVQYKLYYFDLRGAGEPIRLLLTYAKQPFEDVRYDYQKDWNEQTKSKYFYGTLPVLEIDGKKQLAQSATILRYLGGKLGFAGKDEWDRAKVSELIDFHKDVYFGLSPYLHVKGGWKKGDVDELYKDVFVPNAEKYFALYVKKLKESGSGFLLASGLTIVDFLVADYFNMIKKTEPEFLAKFPELVKYVDRFHAQPQLKEYLAKRKD